MIILPADRKSERPFIEVNELSVQFGSQQVLRNIDLSVWRGETLAVIGESGCGKTVLLKTIIGLIRPTDGFVVFDGRRLDELGDKELTAQRGRFGYVFQNAALFDSMTIAENMAFPLQQNRGLRRRKPAASSSSGWPKSACRANVLG